MQYSRLSRTNGTQGALSQNVSEQERTISLIGAGALLLSGLRHLSLKRMAVGGYLAYRGATGYCPLKDQLQKAGMIGEGGNRGRGIREGSHASFSGPREDVWKQQPPRDEVEEASMESFPASDPPNYSR